MIQVARIIENKTLNSGTLISLQCSFETTENITAISFVSQPHVAFFLNEHWYLRVLPFCFEFSRSQIFHKCYPIFSIWLRLILRGPSLSLRSVSLIFLSPNYRARSRISPDYRTRLTTTPATKITRCNFGLFNLFDWDNLRLFLFDFFDWHLFFLDCLLPSTNFLETDYKVFVFILQGSDEIIDFQILIEIL